MPINNISKYIIQPSKIRNFVTHLNKAGVLLPVILLESTVDIGRTYQAYKRGGYTEARERAFEEVTAGIFWLGGVKAFNALGDKIGQKFFGIENPKFSLAKDAVRNPFENMIRDKNLEKSRKFLIGFKFTKVALAVLAAVTLLGFIIPKVNQKITRMFLKGDKKKSENTPAPVYNNSDSLKNKMPAINSAYKGVTFENFINRTKNSQSPAFKGLFNVNTFAKITNNLENHDIWKLLATDTGVFAGRAYNARNNDERVEILVRDGASVYFYLRCKNDVINLLNKLDGYKGKLSNLDPQTAMAVHNTMVRQLLNQMKRKNISGFDIDTVSKMVLGSNPAKVEEQLSKFVFKEGNVIALDDFENLAKNAGVNVDAKLLAKARKMSQLQPQRMLTDLGYDKVGSVLTKQQVKDVLSDSIISYPSFLKRVMTGAFDGDLTNSYSFIPLKDVEKLRTNIDNYAQVLLEYAKKHDIKEITPDVLLKINKKNLVKNAAHIAAGMGVAALFLSTIIPKLQYWITRMRTGSNEFPGVKNIK